MPALSSPELTLWRAHNRYASQYVIVLPLTPIFTAKINQTAFDYPIVQLTYDTVTVGAHTDIKQFQTVVIYDSTGATIKGFGYVRLTPTSSILYINVTGQGDISFADNDVISVCDDYRVWARLPRLDDTLKKLGTFYKDYNLAYTDEGSKPPPKCNAGPFYAGFIDENTNVVTVAFDLTDSYAVAPGATISSYAGDIADGTVTSGTIASGVFTATFPAGWRWCRFTVTDSNSKTHTAVVMVWAAERTGANAPIRARIESHRMALQGGEMTLKLWTDDVSPDVVPHGTLVMMFEEETYGTTAGSLNGYTGREHVKFVGWVNDRNLEIDPSKSTYTINCLSAGRVIQSIPAMNQSVENQTAPTKWYQMKSLTLFRAIWYLLYWHSTVLNLCDLEYPDWGDTKAYSRFDFDQADLYQQANGGAQYVTASLSCDRNNVLRLRRNPILMSDSDRNALTTTVSLTGSEWELLRIEERDNFDPLWIRGSGLLSSTTEITPYLAISPGKMPSQGAQEESYDKQLVDSQSDLNVRLGHYYAMRMAPRPSMTISVPAAGAVADPAWQEWIVITLSASSNRRGLSFSSTRFILKEISIEYDQENGVSSEEWVMAEETTGVSAVTVIEPKEAINDQSISGTTKFRLTTFSSRLFKPILKPTPTFLNTSAVYFMDNFFTYPQSGRLYRCKYVNGAPTTTLLMDLNTMLSEFVQENYGDQVLGVDGFELDPFNPRNGAYVTFRVGSPYSYLVGYIHNLNASAGQQTFEFIDRYTYAAIASFTQPGNFTLHPMDTINGGVIIGAMHNVQSLYIFKRTGLGHQFGGGYTGSDVWVGGYGSLAIGHHNTLATNVRLFFATNDIPTGDTTVYISTDSGATVALDHTISGIGTANAGRMIIPKNDNPSDNIMYLASDIEDVNSLYRRNANGTYDAIGPNIGGDYYSVIDFDNYSLNRLRMVAQLRKAGVDYLAVSTDGGNTWALRNGVPGATTTTWYGRLYRYDYDVAFARTVGLGVLDGVYYTTNLFSGGVSGVVWNLLALGSSFTYGIGEAAYPSVAWMG